MVIHEMVTGKSVTVELTKSEVYVLQHALVGRKVEDSSLTKEVVRDTAFLYDILCHGHIDGSSIHMLSEFQKDVQSAREAEKQRKEKLK